MFRESADILRTILVCFQIFLPQASAYCLSRSTLVTSNELLSLFIPCFFLLPIQTCQLNFYLTSLSHQHDDRLGKNCGHNFLHVVVEGGKLFTHNTFLCKHTPIIVKLYPYV